MLTGITPLPPGSRIPPRDHRRIGRQSRRPEPLSRARLRSIDRTHSAGTRSRAAAKPPPLAEYLSSFPTTGLTVKGYVRPPGETLRGHYSYGGDGNYFTAMGFHLLEGRFLSESDSQRGDRVCVVDEDFARFCWPHTSALGQRLAEGSDQTDDAMPLSWSECWVR